jgi:hypothetical protein
MCSPEFAVYPSIHPSIGGPRRARRPGRGGHRAVAADADGDEPLRVRGVRQGVPARPEPAAAPARPQPAVEAQAAQPQGGGAQEGVRVPGARLRAPRPRARARRPHRHQEALQPQARREEVEVRPLRQALRCALRLEGALQGLRHARVPMRLRHPLLKVPFPFLPSTHIVVRPIWSVLLSSACTVLAINDMIHVHGRVGVQEGQLHHAQGLLRRARGGEREGGDRGGGSRRGTAAGRWRGRWQRGVAPAAGRAGPVADAGRRARHVLARAVPQEGAAAAVRPVVVADGAPSAGAARIGEAARAA